MDNEPTPAAPPMMFDLPADHEQTDATAQLLAREGMSLNELLGGAGPADTTVDRGINGRIEPGDEEPSSGVIVADPTPLSNAKHEAMLRAIVDGVDPGEAYHTYVSARCSRQSAQQTACRLCKGARYQGRLKFLMEEKQRAAGYAPAPGTPPPGDDGGDDMLAVLNVFKTAMRNPAASTRDKIDAAKAYKIQKKEMDDGDSPDGLSLDDLDPTIVCDYFTRAHQQGVAVEVEARALVAEAEGADAASDQLATDLIDSENAPGVQPSEVQ
jgi:hypothetical protein